VRIVNECVSSLKYHQEKVKTFSRVGRREPTPTAKRADNDNKFHRHRQRREPTPTAKRADSEESRHRQQKYSTPTDIIAEKLLISLKNCRR